MTDHDVMARAEDSTDLTTQHLDATGLDTEELDDRSAAYVDFLTDEFPEWNFAIDSTSTWSEDAVPLWIATKDGHHPQSALSASKLHRRLSDYEERDGVRHAGSN